MGDIGAGMFAATGILAALHERDRSGTGQHVDISMLDGQIAMLSYLVSMFGFNGIDPQPMGNAHSVHVPYNTYATSDGHIVIAVLTDKHWKQFTQAMKSDVLGKPEYSSQAGRVANRQVIEDEINRIVGSGSSEFWLEEFKQARIPSGPVNVLSQALKDPQVLHRNMLIDLQHPNGESRKGPGNPIKMSRSSDAPGNAAPCLGQDTIEVLSSLLGYGQERIAQLKNEGVIA